MTKKKMINSQNQENWDNLMLELDYIHERLNIIESHVIALKDASNTLAITVSSLMKMLIEKKVITESELNKMSTKMSRDLKKQVKKEAEKLKKNDKQSLYDALLNADFGGHA